MDSDRFDALTRSLASAASRRQAVRGLAAAAALLGGLGLGRDDAKAARCRREGRSCGDDKGRCCSGLVCKGGKCRCRPSSRCGGKCCPRGGLCCDDASFLCCKKGASCCNPGDGTGSCCDAPGRCAKPMGQDNAPFECCPPERQWKTSAGLLRCCPDGTRALEGITSDDGACCSEEKYCGGTCCGDNAPVCVDPSKQRCCTEEKKCGTKCCGSAAKCVNGECRPDICATCAQNSQQCCPGISSFPDGYCCSPVQICGDLNQPCKPPSN